MGIIRGGLLVIVSVLLFVALIFGYLFFTMAWSLNYANVETELGGVIRTSLGEQVGVESLVLGDYSAMQAYCVSYETYVFEVYDRTLTIPCATVAQGPAAVIDFGITQFIEGIYFSHYDCSFWNCFSEGTLPFFLVSSKAQQYWYSLFIYVLLIIGGLCILGFLLSEKKSNFFILLSVLVFLAALPFSRLSWLFVLGGDVAKGLLSVFFSKAYAVFVRGIILGVALLVIGLVLKLFRIGFRIQTIFQKSEEGVIEKRVVDVKPAPKKKTSVATKKKKR